MADPARHLRLPSRPPGARPLEFRPPVLNGVVLAALLTSGAWQLFTELRQPAGACCTPSYYNHLPSIRFMAAWTALVALQCLVTFQVVAVQGDTVRVRLFGTPLGFTRPLGHVRVTRHRAASGAATDSVGTDTAQDYIFRLGPWPLGIRPDHADYAELITDLPAPH
ncbi:hypothetical protein [Deinococcus aquiradiocola]|uniref:Uncharacterized protein n=1 Tax=Deinococcus aquiradiocola TaxID=393059 RepID=A0A917P577_9DEIO|nr:hypothetical protein [Deinococcus aquiradiocola]GGJ62248.1 hypothetical protein GCM10008939_02590 [Deinococcus aquiradiocola]